MRFRVDISPPELLVGCPRDLLPRRGSQGGTGGILCQAPLQCQAPMMLHCHGYWTIKAAMQYRNRYSTATLEGKNMKTTVDFLDAVKKKHGLTSDYQLSKLMGCTHSSISGYRHGKSKMDEDTACKVAELLNLEPGYVLSCIAAERAKSPEAKAAWKHTAEVLYGLAAVLAVIAFLPTATLPQYDGFNIALAGLALPESGALYIMSNVYVRDSRASG